jgi:NADH:ubiquinone oxidoreductase subunit H
MIFVAVLAVLLFFGGWHSQFEDIAYLESGFAWVPGIHTRIFNMRATDNLRFTFDHIKWSPIGFH